MNWTEFTVVTEEARCCDERGSGTFRGFASSQNIRHYRFGGVPNQRRKHSSQKPDIYDLVVISIFIVSPLRRIKFCDSSVFRNYKNSIGAEVFEVDRIIVASPGKLTQMKWSIAATFMITKALFIALVVSAAPVFADTLAVGSVYFDSAQTLNEVIKLSAQRDNEGIAKLIENGHVSSQTGNEMDIVVLISGATPESPAEFRFLNGPTTFWTLTKNVTNVASPLPTSTPVPSATPASEPTVTSTPAELPTPTPAPAESPIPTSKHHQRQHERNAPFDDDNGQRIWHQVDGKWKWYPADKHHRPVKKALPVDQ
jgi:hypothetical protein